MQLTEPKVFVLGQTTPDYSGVAAYLEHIGASDWRPNSTSGGELLIELYGRACYNSFNTELNPNITKVRTDSKEYIKNILEQGHGSVLEHTTVNFMFTDVSRVFTHELVRHRVGTAISQESLRYVRLDRIDAWPPTVIQENPEAMEIFVNTIEQLESLQIALAKVFELDKGGTSFHTKKEATSAMRRLAPIGLATNIGWTANLRTIRQVLEMRTHPAAEEEIRMVFAQVGELMLKKYPSVFQDYFVEKVNGHYHYRTKNSKV